MNLLFRIVYAAHANGTHHKLALDALRHLENHDTVRWQRLFLQHAQVYLEGSKAPDKEFKDFKNHVLHVADGFWGGAPEKVESWYGRTVAALKAGSWHEAVYAAGIMSHYYTDPIHPFHTGQSPAENNIHRAVEWSISKSYDALWQRAQTKPRPQFELGSDATWIKDHVIAGAEASHAHYETLIAHYNFDGGVVEPPEGLDEICRDLVSDLLVYAAVGHARLLDRAFEEAAVSPPDVNLTAETIVAGLEIPLRWVTRKLSDAADRAQVEAMYDELQRSGTVEENLPADDRQVRDLHRKEVLEPREAGRRQARAARRTRSPLPQGQIPKLACAQPAIGLAKTDSSARAAAAKTAAHDATSQLARLRDRNLEAKATASRVPTVQITAREDNERQRTPRLYLTPGDPIEAAPSIGPKTAARFEAIGLFTVSDLLDADPETTAQALGVRHITPKAVVEWQHQARLVCTLPGLRGTHAQLLVGAGLTSVDAVAETDPGEAMAAVLKFAQTSAGQSVLRDGQPPDFEKIHAWVENARAACKVA